MVILIGRLTVQNPETTLFPFLDVAQGRLATRLFQTGRLVSWFLTITTIRMSAWYGWIYTPFGIHRLWPSFSIQTIHSFIDQYQSPSEKPTSEITSNRKNIFMSNEAGEVIDGVERKLHTRYATPQKLSRELEALLGVNAKFQVEVIYKHKYSIKLN